MFVSKYSANGNDFALFHTFVKKNRSQLARSLCNRQEGIGADGLIVLVPHHAYDFEWQFYNADGSEATMCGNGSRACAHYAFSNALAPGKMCFLTGAGVINAEVRDSIVKSDLTPPKIMQENIDAFDNSWTLIDTGVPHLVSFVDNINTFNLAVAKELRDTYNANVNIAYIDSDGNLLVRTFERGVEDETLACGTGMAASFYKAYLEKLVKSECFVYPKSGDRLTLGIEENTISLTGEVKEIFSTSIKL